MRISSLSSHHADGGWRPFSFLKVTTDEGIVGWSEYSCGMWAPALPQVIAAMGQHITGRDPRDFGVLRRELRAMTRFAAGGLNHQAAAAIENACLDIAAKSAGMSVHQMLGGKLRDRIELYWTHCGSFRARDPELFENLLGRERLDSLDAVKRLGAEIAERGFRAAKTNPILFSADGPILLNPGFVPTGLDHGGTLSNQAITEIDQQVEAWRDGAGPDIDLMFDVNFANSAESVLRLERRLRRHSLRWLEYDHELPGPLAGLRRQACTPIASLEAVHGVANYKAFLDAGSADVAVIDLLWNGVSESLRVAALCDAYGVNVAPHNFYGPMADLMAANFCAVTPNFEIMEFEADDVPWKFDLVTVAPVIENGRMAVPAGIGWGAEINEDCLAHHPWPKTT